MHSISEHTAMLQQYVSRIDEEIEKLKQTVHNVYSYEEKMTVAYQLEEILMALRSRNEWLSHGLKGLKEREQGL